MELLGDDLIASNLLLNLIVTFIIDIANYYICHIATNRIVNYIITI